MLILLILYNRLNSIEMNLIIDTIDKGIIEKGMFNRIYFLMYTKLFL